MQHRPDLVCDLQRNVRASRTMMQASKLHDTAVHANVFGQLSVEGFGDKTLC